MRGLLHSLILLTQSLVCTALRDEGHFLLRPACPIACASAGLGNPSNWTHTLDTRSWAQCTAPILFRFNIHRSEKIDDGGTLFQACSYLSDKPDLLAAQLPDSESRLPRGVARQRGVKNGSFIAPLTDYYSKSNMSASLSGWSEPATRSLRQGLLALQTALATSATEEASVIFYQDQTIILASYTASRRASTSLAVSLPLLRPSVGGDGLLQLDTCLLENERLIIVTSQNAGVSGLQQLKSHLSKLVDAASCRSGIPEPRFRESVIPARWKTISEPKHSESHPEVSRNASMTWLNQTVSRVGGGSTVDGNTCAYVEVISNDGCDTVLNRCRQQNPSLSNEDFMLYNSGVSQLCSSLRPQQLVCCSSGSLPDLTPHAQPDGSCTSYLVKPNDSCWAIADHFRINTDVLEFVNTKTWGWEGCDRLQADQMICLSLGRPPLPTPMQGAQCGPQVPGTLMPPRGVNFADLNPCKLNACCDKWGYCGTTDEFCTVSKPNPEGSRPKVTLQNECISHCSRSMVRGPRVANFHRIGYFEAWNQDRSCLNMAVEQIPTAEYTHIHFAFATINADFTVSLSGVEQQFEAFLKLQGVRKVLSFGGWAFSTEPATYRRFRDATQPSNQDRFVTNILEFLAQYGLDGLDFDWEYPSAPDIPDIPPGDIEEGSNYENFLYKLRMRMSRSRSLSIAAPASFWYLKGFPIAAMASWVDYFVYMTYDLHGNWDYGNKWSMADCPGGNCLRSHVNFTETVDALAMLTKAGVPAAKIMVGISSYGRGFRMSNPSCTGPMCTWTTTNGRSNAFPGTCTGVAGYISNAEINSIKDGSDAFPVHNAWYDADSDSDILVYGNSSGVDWVAYMGDEVKQARSKFYQNMGFGGTVEWAIDLNREYPEVSTNDDTQDNDDFCNWGIRPPNLEQLAKVSSALSPRCSTLFAMDILQDDLDQLAEDYQRELDNYDHFFHYYAEYIRNTINENILDFLKLDGGAGNKYFDCKWNQDGVKGGGPCPPQKPFSLAEGGYIIEYSLRDENGFFAELASKYGVLREWVKFGDYAMPKFCESTAARVAEDNDATAITIPDRKICFERLRRGFPQRKDNVNVPNPKDILSSALANGQVLQYNALDAFLNMNIGAYQGLLSDPVLALATPVFMLQDAVQGMRNVKDIGAKAEEREKKEQMITILNIIGMLIPLAGPLAVEAFGGTAMLATLVLAVGETANVAVFGYTVSQDPTMALPALLGMAVGFAIPGGGRRGNAEIYREAADARRGLSAERLKSFSPAFQQKDQQVQTVLQRCRR